MSGWADAGPVILFVLVMGGLVVLFAAGTRRPPVSPGWRRAVVRGAVTLVAATVVVLANMALYRHDLHVDVTYSGTFTPSAEARRVAQALTTDVDLIYFYQKQDPAGRVAKTMVEILGRSSPRLHVRTVDPDQLPGLANHYGVRVYNVAVIETGGRRLQVASTEDRDLALGILRATRASVKTVCFAVGHGEYDIDNFEYHTHFEGHHAHSHGAEGLGVVLTEQHGVGRLRRALESLGFEPRKVTLATSGGIPPDCAALVEVGPRTRWAPPESAALAAHLGRGGSALLMLDLGFPLEPGLVETLGRAGVALDEGAVVDPLDHYFTDDQMVAVARYDRHVITRGLALSFFPGVRPLHSVPAPGVRVTPLVSSSDQSYVRSLGVGPPAPPGRARGPRPLAVAAEGAFGNAAGVAPFRLVVVGDADFASNSFFPYMSNTDLVLAMVSWLVHEERGPTVRPPVEVLPRVVLTSRQVRGIFVLTVLVLPGAAALVGSVVWWQRRR